MVPIIQSKILLLHDKIYKQLNYVTVYCKLQIFLSILTNPRQYTTMKSQHFQGRQRPSLTEARGLGREAVGGIEDSGYTENTLIASATTERDRASFSIYYQNRYNSFYPPHSSFSLPPPPPPQLLLLLPLPPGFKHMYIMYE